MVKSGVEMVCVNLTEHRIAWEMNLWAWLWELSCLYYLKNNNRPIHSLDKVSALYEMERAN